jgi:hypothetical protein
VGSDGTGSSDSADEPDNTDEPDGLAFTTGRRMTPGARPGNDINYNPDAVLYGGFYVASDSVSRYIEILNSYRSTLPDNVRIFSLLVPSSAEFMDERYVTDTGVQDRTIRNIYGRLDDGIVTVDAYSRIAANVRDEYLYFRTDHHWTALGAYYAYLAFAQAAGLEAMTINNYVEFALPGYIGSFAVGTQDRVIVENPDTLYYYMLDRGITFSQNLIFIPQDPSMIGYLIFLGGDHPIIDITSSNRNGKTLIVIKDSFANAFVPWVAPNYERVIVLDPRLYNGSVEDIISSLDEVDILIMTSAFTPSLHGFVERIADIR